MQDFILSKGMSEKMERALARLITNDPFWGRMAQDITWKRDDKQEFAMGVGLSRQGFIGYYNMRIMDESKLSIHDIEEIIKHELWHIILRHLVRFLTQIPPQLQNVAMDMVVNGTKEKPRVNVPDESIWCKSEWEEMTFEEIMKEIMESSCMKCPMLQMQNGVGQNGQGDDKEDGDGEGQENGKDQDEDGERQGNGQGDGEGKEDGEGEGGGGNQCGSEFPSDCPMKGIGPCPFHGSIFDDHAFAIDSSAGLDESEYRQLIKTRIEEAIKHAGKMPGGMEDILKELGESIINWKAQLRLFVGRQIGGKRPTIKRRNRRVPIFGFKGQTKKSGARLTIFVDTSGSISDKELSQFFGEIEVMSRWFKVAIVQWDTQITDINRNYHRGDWKNITIRGRGGTNLDASLKEAEEKKLIGDCNIILSDMEFYSNVPEKSYPIIWVTTSSAPPDFAKIIVELNVKEERRA